MNNTSKLYKEYSLINNLLLMAEGERDNSEYSNRPSIQTDEEIQNFRSEVAWRTWNQSFLLGGNPRRFSVMSTTNQIRNICQNWMDMVRSREQIMRKDGNVKNRFQMFILHTKFSLQGRLKEHKSNIETMVSMFADVAYRLDQLEGGVENQQETQARIEQKAMNERNKPGHIGFGFSK